MATNVKRKAKVEGIPGWMHELMKGFYKLPMVNRWHPWVRADKTDMRWLPINEDIQMPSDTPMPLEVLDRIIEEASHRALFDFCGCRKAFHCKHYPTEVGCLMMGDSAIESKASVPFRDVSVEEAKAHARKAIEAGLVPIVGKARVDNYLFKIKDRKKLLTVCFCCECCCVTRLSALMPLKIIEPAQPHLESLVIEFDPEKCKGCGKCVKTCYIQAITMVDKKASIGEYCRACGRCAIQCPNGAIELKITDPEFVEKTLDRIRSYVKYD